MKILKTLAPRQLIIQTLLWKMHLSKIQSNPDEVNSLLFFLPKKIH